MQFKVIRPRNSFDSHALDFFALFTTLRDFAFLTSLSSSLTVSSPSSYAFYINLLSLALWWIFEPLIPLLTFWSLRLWNSLPVVIITWLCSKYGTQIHLALYIPISFWLGIATQIIWLQMCHCIRDLTSYFGGLMFITWVILYIFMYQIQFLEKLHPDPGALGM